MRPLLTLLMAVVILGSLGLYMKIRKDFGPAAGESIQRPAPGLFSLEITLTFDAGPDIFALEAQDAPSLQVSFRGKELLRRTGPIAAGTPIRINVIKGIVQGDSEQSGSNEFYVKVTPQDTESLLSRAVRVRLYRDDEEIAQRSLWSEPGRPVEGAVRVVVLATEEVDSHAKDQP